MEGFQSAADIPGCRGFTLSRCGRNAGIKAVSANPHPDPGGIGDVHREFENIGVIYSVL
jgi:hypothetical protein